MHVHHYSQALSKMLPLLQKFSSKSTIEIIVVIIKNYVIHDQDHTIVFLFRLILS